MEISCGFFLIQFLKNRDISEDSYSLDRTPKTGSVHKKMMTPGHPRLQLNCDHRSEKSNLCVFLATGHCD